MSASDESFELDDEGYYTVKMELQYYWPIMGVVVRNVPILPHVTDSAEITLSVYNLKNKNDYYLLAKTNFKYTSKP